DPFHLAADRAHRVHQQLIACELRQGKVESGIRLDEPLVAGAVILLEVNLAEPPHLVECGLSSAFARRQSRASSLQCGAIFGELVQFIDGYMPDKVATVW